MNQFRWTNPDTEEASRMVYDWERFFFSGHVSGTRAHTKSHVMDLDGRILPNIAPSAY
jgi:hypothetical protein